MHCRDAVDPPELLASSHQNTLIAEPQKSSLLEPPPVFPPVVPPVLPLLVVPPGIATGDGVCSGSPSSPPQAAIVRARIVNIHLFMMSSLVTG
jgi:hypothetical protein